VLLCVARPNKPQAADGKRAAADAALICHERRCRSRPYHCEAAARGKPQTYKPSLRYPETEAAATLLCSKGLIALATFNGIV
jgi:hypothetical protein